MNWKSKHIHLLSSISSLPKCIRASEQAILNDMNADGIIIYSHWMDELIDWILSVLPSLIGFHGWWIIPLTHCLSVFAFVGIAERRLWKNQNINHQYLWFPSLHAINGLCILCWDVLCYQVIHTMTYYSHYYPEYREL